MYKIKEENGFSMFPMHGEWEFSADIYNIVSIENPRSFVYILAL